MLIGNLMREIDAHPASTHDVFKRLARRRLPAAALAKYLRAMGAFCAASRPAGNVVSVLRDAQLAQTADLVDEIFRSEANHGEDFAAMARILLSGTPFAQEDWCSFPFNELPNPVLSAITVFHVRSGMERTAALFSLGAMLPLERAADQQIIPGQVAAFITSGFYGRFQLTDIPYLQTHAGDTGAEHCHAQLITNALESLPLGSGADEGVVEYGCIACLDALNEFYNHLAAIIDDAA